MMKQVFFILILAMILACSGHNSKNSKEPIVINDSIMFSKGYDLIQLPQVEQMRNLNDGSISPQYSRYCKMICIFAQQTDK